MLKVGMKVKLVGPKDLSRKSDAAWIHWQHFADKEFVVEEIKDSIEVADYFPNEDTSGLKLVMISGIVGYCWDHWLKPIPAKGQVNCPMCGWPADPGFNLVYCTNESCRNGHGYGTNFDETKHIAGIENHSEESSVNPWEELRKLVQQLNP